MSRVQHDLTHGEAGPWISIAIVAFMNLLVYIMNERNVFRCCLPCNRGGLLGVTNRAASVSRSKRPESFFAWDLLDAKHLATGKHVPTGAVLALRLFNICVYVFTVCWQTFGIKELRSGKKGYVTYFTHWTFAGFGLCSLLGCFVCIKALRAERTTQNWSFSDTPKTSPYSLLDKAYHFVYMAIAPASGALSIFFWLVVYDGKRVTIDNILKHGTSFVLLLVDLLLCRMPIVSYHVVIPTWYATAYSIFLWVWYDQTGNWRYRALDWTKPSHSIYYLAMVLLLYVMVTIIYWLAGLREWSVTHKCCCMCECCGCCGACCEPDPETTGEFGSTGTFPEYKAPYHEQFVSS